MKIIIDNIVFYIQKRGGVSVVWHEMIKRLLKNDSLNPNFLEYGLTENIFRNNLIINDDNIIKNNSRLLGIKRYLNPKVSSQDKFIFHSTYYRTCSNKNAINITTVHDFTYELFYPFLKKKLHCWQKYRAIKHSDYVICVSENTKKDCLKYVKGIDKSKLVVIYNGVSDDYHLLNNDFDTRLPFEKESYILFVGDRSHYKNFNFVIDYWKKSEYNLVIVGSQLNEQEKINVSEKIDSNYVVETGISNKRLNELYNGALCLMYPSNYEGFGIPVIEAQRAGCPVITFNSSSIPEIIGDHTLLLQKLDIEELKQKMEILKDSDRRQKIIDDGLKNSTRFSWDKTYQKLEELYHKAYLEKNLS